MKQNNYNLKLHHILITDIELVRDIENSIRTRMFMKGLEESISELGVLMPLLVMQKKDEYKFVLIDGYKRLAALKKINKNLLGVDVLIADGSIENISFSVNRVRGELSKLYQALYLHNILTREKITQNELAKRFMLSKGEISKLLGVAKQPSLARMVTTGMSMTTAKNISMGLSDLEPEKQEIQLKNIKAALPYSEIPTRKFEKIINIMNDYIHTTHDILEPRKLRRIKDYVDEHGTIISTDKIVKSLAENSRFDDNEISPAQLLYAVRAISESSDHKHLKYEVNESAGTVMLKLKMNPEEFKRFKKLLNYRPSKMEYEKKY